MSEILGCAYRGGSVVIVSHAPADVWAHEWGHVQGLNHRDDCETNIMHSYELQTDAVNTTEKNAFLSDTPNISVFQDHPASTIRIFGLKTLPVSSKTR